MASEAPSKRQKTSKDVPYNLIYWPGIPGRGEHIRLALEFASAPYTDTAHTPSGIQTVLSYISNSLPPASDPANLPICAPPILQHGDLVINQTPNILLYLAPKLNLAPTPEEDEHGICKVNELVLTALDGLSDEPHNVHHPVSTSLYYEDQKEEAVRAASAYVDIRLPKFLGYFERVLGSEASGEGPWLVGGRTTVADLVLFQCLDGVAWQHPKAVKKYRESGKFDRVFGLYEAVKEIPKIKEYLASERRQKYGEGIYRKYPDIDLEPEEQKEGE